MEYRILIYNTCKLYDLGWLLITSILKTSCFKILFLMWRFFFCGQYFFFVCGHLYCYVDNVYVNNLICFRQLFFLSGHLFFFVVDLRNERCLWRNLMLPDYFSVLDRFHPTQVILFIQKKYLFFNYVFKISC